jgi:hypothetical protein
VKRILFVAAAMLTVGAGPGRAASLSDNGRIIAGCINAAADVYRLPPAVLVILLNVEGGSLGHVSQNTNATVDIGPMQVNQIWIPQVAAHWHATEAATFHALRDDFCANVEAGSWILRQGLDEARGDFWQGVGYYHSHDPQHKATYLQAVLKQVLRLRASVDRQATNHPAAEPPVIVARKPPTVLADGN